MKLLGYFSRRLIALALGAALASASLAHAEAASVGPKAETEGAGPAPQAHSESGARTDRIIEILEAMGATEAMEGQIKELKSRSEFQSAKNLEQTAAKVKLDDALIDRLERARVDYLAAVSAAIDRHAVLVQWVESDRRDLSDTEIDQLLQFFQSSLFHKAQDLVRYAPLQISEILTQRYSDRVARDASRKFAVELKSTVRECNCPR